MCKEGVQMNTRVDNKFKFKGSDIECESMSRKYTIHPIVGGPEGRDRSIEKQV